MEGWIHEWRKGEEKEKEEEENERNHKPPTHLPVHEAQVVEIWVGRALHTAALEGAFKQGGNSARRGAGEVAIDDTVTRRWVGGWVGG